MVCGLQSRWAAAEAVCKHITADFCIELSAALRLDLTPQWTPTALHMAVNTCCPGRSTMSACCLQEAMRKH